MCSNLRITIHYSSKVVGKRGGSTGKAITSAQPDVADTMGHQQTDSSSEHKLGIGRKYNDKKVGYKQKKLVSGPAGPRRHPAVVLVHKELV